MPQNDDEYKIELFIFPDGTAMEMIVFDHEGTSPISPAAPAGGTVEDSRRQTGAQSQPTATQAPAATVPQAAGELHVCPICGSALVYPIDWQRESETSWSLSLRCPNCETQRTVIMGRESVEELNRELYHGAQALAHEADIVSRRNFEEEAEKLIEALAAGLIQPIDF